MTVTTRTSTRRSGLVVVERDGPLSWDGAEIIDWPVGPKKGKPLQPRVLVRRKINELSGPNDERVFFEDGYRVISLFTGIGGFDLGAEQAGFITVVQHEWDKTCCETLIHNRPKFFRHAALIQGDIRITPTSMILREANLRCGEAELLTGGPPCQGFSVAGKRRAVDERNDLVFEYLRVVNEAKPHYFSFENVPGFITLNRGAYMKAFLQRAYDCYYELVYGLVNAVEYGVPQDRTRFICMGTRRDLHQIDGLLACLPTPECFSERDLNRIKMFKSMPLWRDELELLKHPPGIRYFPDRPILIPPRPCAKMSGFEDEDGEADGGRTERFIEFYRRLRRDEPDRIMFSPQGGGA